MGHPPASEPWAAGSDLCSLHSSTTLRLLRPQPLHRLLASSAPHSRAARALQGCVLRLGSVSARAPTKCRWGGAGEQGRRRLGSWGPTIQQEEAISSILENRHKKGGRKLAFVLPEIKFLQSKRRGRPQAAAPGQTGWEPGRGVRACVGPDARGRPVSLQGCGAAAVRGRGSRGSRWCWGKNGTDWIRDSESTAGLRPSGRAACMCVVARCLAAGLPQAARARVQAQFSPARQWHRCRCR